MYILIDTKLDIFLYLHRTTSSSSSLRQGDSIQNGSHFRSTSQGCLFPEEIASIVTSSPTRLWYETNPSFNVAWTQIICFYWTSFDIEELCTKEITSSWSKFDQGFKYKASRFNINRCRCMCIYIYIFPSMWAPVLGYWLPVMSVNWSSDLWRWHAINFYLCE